jgi:glyoxylase-like metal-dependent hydrolase (beta-lactamase superfamily II)
MRIKSIIFSAFKVQGRKMFGNTPEDRWQKIYPADKKGLCSWALRSLLIDDGQNLVLIDTGFSDMDRQVLEEYSIVNFKIADKHIEDSGVPCETITHLLHTHLHVDHCGGSFKSDGKNNLVPSFPNASYICSKQQLISASNPSSFEKDSFQPEIISAFTAYSGLKQIETNCYLFPWLELRIFNGHTKGLLIPFIHFEERTLVFAGDLIPSAAHLVLESIMSYNIDLKISLKEQKVLLEEAAVKNYILFFQHDFLIECCSLKYDKGKIVPDKIFRVSELNI